MPPEIYGEGDIPLHSTQHDDDGQRVRDATANKASVVGAIRLLEEIARRDDNKHYRASARKMADGLKDLLKKVTRNKPLTDAEILGPVLEEQRKLPAPQRRLGNDEVIDV